MYIYIYIYIHNRNVQNITAKREHTNDTYAAKRGRARGVRGGLGASIYALYIYIYIFIHNIYTYTYILTC